MPEQSISEVIESIFPSCKESPLCCYPPLQSGYCFRHEPRKEKVKKRINPVGEKRKKDNVKLAAIVKEMKESGVECRIKSPECTRLVVTANHIQKRSPKNLVDINNLEACCAECNSYIENHPEWAKEHGHQISRFKK